MSLNVRFDYYENMLTKNNVKNLYARNSQFWPKKLNSAKKLAKRDREHYKNLTTKILLKVLICETLTSINL